MAWWVNLTLVVIGLLVILIPFILVRRCGTASATTGSTTSRGLMSKSIDTLELWHVDDIKFHQSFFDRMFGVGDITVISHDDTTPCSSSTASPSPARCSRTSSSA